MQKTACKLGLVALLYVKIVLVFYSIYIIYRLILKKQALNESSYNNSQIA